MRRMPTGKQISNFHKLEYISDGIAGKYPVLKGEMDGKFACYQIARFDFNEPLKGSLDIYASKYGLGAKASKTGTGCPGVYLVENGLSSSTHNILSYENSFSRINLYGNLSTHLSADGAQKSIYLEPYTNTKVKFQRFPNELLFTLTSEQTEYECGSLRYTQTGEYTSYALWLPTEYGNLTTGCILEIKKYDETSNDNAFIIGKDFDERSGGFRKSCTFSPSQDSITLTCTPSGTATLKIHRTSGTRFNASTEIIPDRIGLHMDITSALGASTSQQITLSQEDGIDLSTLNATGVLLNGTSLVGCCHLVGRSQNQAVLYFQNALGSDLQEGIYIANLTSVLDN